MNIDRDNLVNEFNNAVQNMLNDTNHAGCYHWHLDTDDSNNNCAIVLGYNSEDYLCAKVAYQPSNSIMQCDYDVDWIMPYDSETGEVWDTNTYIENADESDTSQLIDWLLGQYSDMVHQGIVATA